MAYGRRLTYQNKTGPTQRFMHEMTARAADLEAEEYRMERMVDDRPLRLKLRRRTQP